MEWMVVELRPPHTAQTQTNKEKQSAHHRVKRRTQNHPSHTPHWFTSTPPIRMVIQLAQTNQSSQWLRWPTSNVLRLRKMNRGRRCPCGPKSFQCSWTHRTDLFPNLSESPQALQMANVWLRVFQALEAIWLPIVTVGLVCVSTS